jgi:hypothetical protein
VQLKVAERRSMPYSHLAQKNNTMIVPSNREREIGALIGLGDEP